MFLIVLQFKRLRGILQQILVSPVNVTRSYKIYVWTRFIQHVALELIACISAGYFMALKS